MEERATAMRLLGVEPRFMHHRFIPKDEFSRLLDAGARRDQAPPRPAGLGHFAPGLMITTPRPLLPKRGTCPSPNLSPHGERLKKFFAETAEKFYVLVSRDTRWVFYRCRT